MADGGDYKADELSEDDGLLLKVSAYLEGSEEKARSFWKAWHETGRYEMTEEEVRKLLLRGFLTPFYEGLT